MKKLFLFSIIATSLSLASCVKNRTCTCSDGYTVVLKATKKAAKTSCDALADPSAGVTCSLK